MEYSSGSSSLSMSGGDDFTGISEVLDRAVLLDTTQTISSAKTFGAGFTQQFDEGLEIATGKSVKGDGLLNLNGITGTTLEVNSIDKVVVDTTATTITNATINLQDSQATPVTRFSQNNGTTTITNTNIGTNGILTQTGSATLKGATITLQDATPTTRFLQNDGTTSITNTNIWTNGILTQTGSATLRGATIDLQDATPTTRFAQNNGTTTITNTNIGTNGILTQTGNFTANGTTLTLQNAGTTRYLQNAGTTTLTNTTINLQDATPTTRFSQNNGTTSITNTNINTTGFHTQTGDTSFVGKINAVSQSIYLYDNEAIPVQHFLQNNAQTIVNNNTIELRDIADVGRYTQSTSTTELRNGTINLRDNTPTTRFSQNNGTTTITNTNIGTNGILTQTGSATLKGTTITLQDATPTTRFLQNNGTTTITNTNIGTNGILTQTGSATLSGTTITLRDATPTTRFLQNNGQTTITNTNIGTNGILTQTGASTLTSGTANNTITTTTGTNTMSATGLGSNVMSSANTTATANLITATAGLGGNTMRTTTGVNYMFVSSTSTSNTGENFLEVAGGNGGNVLKAIGAGTGAGGYNSIVGRNNYYDISPNTGSHYIRIGATGSEVNKIVVNNTTTTMTNTDVGVVGRMTATTYSTGTTASRRPLLSFQVHGHKNSTDTANDVLFAPFYGAGSNATTDRVRFFCFPVPITLTKMTLMFDSDVATNTTMTFKFYFKTQNNSDPFIPTSVPVLYHTETMTCEVDTTQTNSQVENINGTTGLEYEAGEIMNVEYSGSPGSEWGVVFYGFQR